MLVVCCVLFVGCWDVGLLVVVCCLCGVSCLLCHAMFVGCCSIVVVFCSLL